MIEHEPWVGDGYAVGLAGQRICVVGYSHHRTAQEADNNEFTKETIQDVIGGELRGDAFFSRVRGYFDFKDEATGGFWNKIMFFNFLPDCIGTTEKRYGRGTDEQVARGRLRFLRIIRERKPHKVLVFTAKGWHECPPTREERANNTPFSLGLEFPKFSWGTYDVDGFIVMAFGLIHPQFANGNLMRKTVRHILQMPLVK